MRGVVLALFFAASVAALAGIGDGFGLGDNGGFAGAAGLGQPKRPGVAAPSPTFDLVAGATTPNDLSDSLTVNSTSMTLVLACDAQGISGTDWTCRDANGTVTLSEAGTGSSPTTTISTPFHALDSAERVVRFATTGKYYEAATTSVGQIGAEDAVIELVTLPGICSGSGAIIGTAIPGAGVPGWAINRTATNCRGNLSVSDGTTTTTGGSTNSIWASTNHALYAIDSGVAITNSYAYNGAAPTTLATTAGDLTSTGKFGIGTVSGSTTTPVGIASLRIWKCANCIVSITTDLSTIARERAAMAHGISPTIAAGTAAPTALTRASIAMTDVVDGATRQLYFVGVGAPRVARRTYSGGTAVAGYLSEPAVSNIALQSQTLGTTWAAITAGDNVLANTFAGADLTTTGDNIDGDNSSAEHGLRQNITVTATSYTFSAWARAGSQSWVALRNNTVANGAAWFDLTTCTSSSCVIGEDCASAVGTTQAGVARASAERYPLDTDGDGTADENLCRVSITYTGTAASHAHDLLCAPSDNNLTYTDADTDADCGFWGVRVEAYPTATSYLATTTAAVARNADDVRFDGASHYTGDPSTMDVQVLCPNFDIAANSSFVSAGSSTSDYALLRVSSADFASVLGFVATSQWSFSASTGDVSDGVLHSIRQTMATDNIEAFYDGTSFGTDTLATLPTIAGSSIFFGTTGGTAAQTGCLISRARLWSSLVTPAVVP
ncbi:MAG: phage head spike fiber domain-containing protein [Candidatus Limnocylindrus sp.]